MHRSIQSLGGSLTALVTPFRDTQLDLPALARLAARQIDHGTDGLVVCGSTGEAQSLSTGEFAQAVAAVVAAARGRVPVIAGCTSPSTAATMALSEQAARAGADGLLCAVPPYVKPTQDGIVAHIRAVAHAADLPIVIYDVPSRSGTAIADATIARLFAAELIVGVKDATADLSRPPRLHALCGEGLVQFSGDDATTAGYRAMGGDGCISVTANVTPALCAQLHRAWDQGDRRSFAAVRDLLHPLHAALFAESNPIPVKAAMDQLGLCGSDVRLPLTRATPATQERLLHLLESIITAEQHAAMRPPYALAS
ncbi:MAG TPA: 4-hydroxy-tetrahydrodipicolinate synthase [Acetobacteraceae bacterium]|jgi:4-hydroxy-tetrahydrodipicolinate synthase|nr:4-hydroxy-tetrahydrodipicolinate synthase [Acetobacteraceae bacterium]